MNSAEVILINPPVCKIKEWHYERTKYPRLGLGYLAAYLEQQQVNCKVIDVKFEGLEFNEVLKIVRESSPLLVGITAMTPEIIDAARLAESIKKDLPGVSIVIGGAHAYALPVRTLEEFNCFDFLIYGEGEISVYELVLALRRKKRLEEIDGLVFRENGKINCNKPRELLKDLDILPFPAWHLFPVAEVYPIMASRGCPFRCVFCMRTSGNKIRTRMPEKIIEEMCSVYEKYKSKEFDFYDETFGIDSKQTYRLLDLIIQKGLPKKITWEVQTRVDVVDCHLLKKMKEAGCTWVDFGIESGNKEILKLTQKNITLEQAEKAVTWAKKAGLKTRSFFILGQPYDTKKTMKDTIDFGAKLNTDTLALGIMVPYPGTKVAEMAEKGEGNYRLLSRNWADYNKQIGNALEMKDVSRKELERLQLWGYVKFYMYNFSFSKIREIFKLTNFRTIFNWLIRIALRWNPDFTKN